MPDSETDNARAERESRELLERARRQVESLPNWKVSYDVRREVQELTASCSDASGKRVQD